MPVKFWVPDGQDRDDASPEEIEARILHAGPEFWEAGSGDAAVRFAGEVAQGEITLMVREPYGVFVQFTESGSGRELVLSTGESQDATVTVDQGGEPWELPRAFWVPRELAARTVASFARTGRLPETELWVPF